MSQITMKEAVSKAKLHLVELFSDDALRAVALEEIELRETQSRKVWAVTLGFQRQQKEKIAMPRVNWLRDQEDEKLTGRVYKTLLIDSETGNFLKMDIRQVS